MNLNRAFKLRSFVHYFCTFSFLFFAANDAYSACDARKIREMCEQDPRPTSVKCDNSDYSCTASVTGADPCEAAKRRADGKKDDFTKACRDAGMGIGTCKSKMQTCKNTGEAEEYKNDPDLLIAFSEALGIPQNQPGAVAAACPKYSGQSFFDKREKYQKDLDDINKQLKDNKKELAELNKEFGDDVKKVQEDIADAQKDYEELTAKTKEEQRERAVEQAKSAAEMAQNIRKLETAIMTKHQEIDTIYMEKNNSLAQITEAAAKRTCMHQVSEEKKKYDALKSGSLRSGFAAASIKKKQLQDLFNECMVKFDQGRMKIIQQTDAKVEAAEREIRNSQSDIDSMKTQLSQAANFEQQAQQDETTKLTSAQSALGQKIQRATAELQNLQKTTETKAQALKEEQKYLIGKSNGISNQIAALGPAPEDESSTGKMSDVDNAFDSYESAVMAVGKVDGCNYHDDILSDPKAKSKSGSSSKSKGSSSASKGSR